MATGDTNSMSIQVRSGKLYINGQRWTSDISQNIDANQIRIGENLFGVTGTFHGIENLFIPTMATRSGNGITCTANGDGTYTVNGTATAAFAPDLGTMTFKAGVTYKIVGSPTFSSTSMGGISVRKDSDGSGIGTYDIGSGITITLSEDTVVRIRLVIQPAYGAANNLVFKPMVTTDLSATYESFVKGIKEDPIDFFETFGKSRFGFTKMAVDTFIPSTQALVSQFTIPHSLGERPKLCFVILNKSSNFTVPTTNILCLVLLAGGWRNLNPSEDSYYYIPYFNYFAIRGNELMKYPITQAGSDGAGFGNNLSQTSWADYGNTSTSIRFDASVYMIAGAEYKIVTMA